MRNSTIIIIILILLSAILTGFSCPTSVFAQDHGDDFVIAKYVKMKSKILNEERTLLLRLPNGYEKSKTAYPVLYTLDADWDDLFNNIAAASGFLNEFGYIPKVIVVGICNTDRSRDMLPFKVDYEPTSGGGYFFLRFIAEELKPFIDKNYRTEPFSILYGGSFAGLFTAYTMLEKPNTFNAYITSSPGIGTNPDYFFAKAKSFFENRSVWPKYMYMVYGENDYPQSVSHTAKFYDFLTANAPGDFKCQMEMIKNEGHVPFIGPFNGLRFIFAEWKFPEDRRAKAGLDEIKQHFSQVAKQYGFSPIIPADILISLGYWSLRKDKLTEAIEALLLACELHPYSPDAFYYLGEAYEKNNQIDLALKNYIKAWEVDPSYLMAKQKIQMLKPMRPFLLEKSSQVFEPVWSFQPGLADLDNDGDLDVVLPNMGRNFSQVLFNNGKGKFDDSGQKLTQQGHGVGIGDLNGDGYLDCIITCAGYGENKVFTYKPTTVYLNDGKGVFRDSGLDLGDGVKDRGGYVVGLSDMDGDGDLDFVKGLWRSPTKIFLNDGKGRFSDSGKTIPKNSFLGDLDGDGDTDVFVKETGVGYKTLLNNGAMDFIEHWKGEDNHAIGSAKDTALGDLDGDGDLDVFITNGDRSGSFPSLVWLNDGTGRFTDSAQQLGSSFFGWIVLGDLNGDGSLDAFISNFQQPNQIWFNDGSGNFSDSGLRLSGEATTRGCALGDLDGDGDLDVFVANFRTGSNEIWFNMSSDKPPSKIKDVY